MALSKIGSRLKKEYSKLKADRSNWESTWQTVAEKIRYVKADFQATMTKGEFVTEDIFDITAAHASRVCSSTMVSMLAPSGAKTTRLRPPGEIAENSPNDEEIKYYKFLDRQFHRYVDHPTSNLHVSISEFYADEIDFGTAGIGVYKGEATRGENPVVFKPYCVKECVIAEDAYGRVNTVYILLEYTIAQVKEYYGEEALTAAMQKSYEENKHTQTFKILWAIKPREHCMGQVPGNSPFVSIHVSWDTGKVLKRAKFNSFPQIWARWEKKIKDVYGYGPGIIATPLANAANALQEAIIMAIDKNLDPPYMVTRETAALNNGVLDTSPGALNMMGSIENLNGDKSPLVPLITNGDIRTPEQLMQRYQEQISMIFFLDRLLDIQNDARMTAYETSIRDRLRAESLGGLFARQEVEIFIPLYERAIEVLFSQGYLGVVKGSIEEQIVLNRNETPVYIPERIARLILGGHDFYELSFNTPARRMIKTLELQNLSSFYNSVLGIAEAKPEILDKINGDITIDDFAELTGINPRIIVEDGEVQKIRDNRAKAQAEERQIAMREADAKANAMNGQAMQSQVQAGAIANEQG